MPSLLLHKEICKTAYDAALPAIEFLISRGGVFKRDEFHVIIGTYGLGVENSVLFEESYNSEKWKKDYAAIAHGKYAASLRTGLSSRNLLNKYPELLAEGDAKWAGSVVSGGIIVACSGFQDYLDEMVCNMLIAILRGLMIKNLDERMHAHQETYVF